MDRVRSVMGKRMRRIWVSDLFQLVMEDIFDMFELSRTGKKRNVHAL